MLRLFQRPLLELMPKAYALIFNALLNVAPLQIRMIHADALEELLLPLAVNQLRELLPMLLVRKKKLKEWSTTIRKS